MENEGPLAAAARYNLMRRRQRNLVLVLLAALCPVGTILALDQLEPTKSLGKTTAGYALVGIAFAGYLVALAQLRCPSCRRRAWPPRAERCPSCSVSLKDGALRLPPLTGQAAAQEGRRLASSLAPLVKLAIYERRATWTIVATALACGLLVLVYAPARHDMRMSVPAAGALAALSVGCILWFFLVYVPCTILRGVLLVWRAKCPR
jgi:hypothetical protein